MSNDDDLIIIVSVLFIIIIVVALVPKIEDPKMTMSRLTVSGSRIFDADGIDMTGKLRGVNIQGVAWEDFSDGYYIMNHNQFHYMRDWGINCIRFCFESYVVARWKTNAATRTNMDDLIQLAEDHGMYVILSGWHLGEDETIASKFNNDVSGWGAGDWTDWEDYWTDDAGGVGIATRYNGKTNVIYDLLNEPLFLSEATQQTKFNSCIAAIRAIDSDVPIIVEESGTGTWGTRDLTFVRDTPITGTNIIYSGHIYYDSDQEWAYPTTSEALIRAKITSVREGWDWCLANNKPVFIGECNANTSNSSYEEFLTNLYTILEDDGYAGWCAWQWLTPSLGDYPLINDTVGNASSTGAILQTSMNYTRPIWAANLYVPRGQAGTYLTNEVLEAAEEMGITHLLLWQENFNELGVKTISESQMVDVVQRMKNYNLRPIIFLGYNVADAVSLVTALDTDCMIYGVGKEPHVGGTSATATSAEYVVHWNDVVTGAKAVNPGAMYGGPAVGSPTTSSRSETWLRAWLNGCSGDFVSVHSFPGGSTQATAISRATSYTNTDVADLLTIMADYGKEDLPIFFTEIQWTSAVVLNGWDYDQAFNDAWTSAMMTAMEANSEVECVALWVLLGFDNNFAILRPPSRGLVKKPQFYSVQDYLDASSPTVPPPDSPIPPPLIEYYTVTTQASFGGKPKPLGTFQYPAGQAFSAVAVADTDFTFTSWTNNGADAGTSPNITIYGEANYEYLLIPTFTLDSPVEPDPPDDPETGWFSVNIGTATGGTTSLTGEQTLVFGDTLVVTVDSIASNYQFRYWLLDNANWGVNSTFTLAGAIDTKYTLLPVFNFVPPPPPADPFVPPSTNVGTLSSTRLMNNLMKTTTRQKPIKIGNIIKSMRKLKL
jgi:hypothetical protein